MNPRPLSSSVSPIISPLNVTLVGELKLYFAWDGLFLADTRDLVKDSIPVNTINSPSHINVLDTCLRQLVASIQSRVLVKIDQVSSKIQTIDTASAGEVLGHGDIGEAAASCDDWSLGLVESIMEVCELVTRQLTSQLHVLHQFSSVECVREFAPDTHVFLSSTLLVSISCTWRGIGSGLSPVN